MTIDQPSADVRIKLLALCVLRRQELLEVQPLLSYVPTERPDVNLNRSNSYAPDKINRVEYEGRFCMSSWNMGTKAVQLLRLLRRRDLSYRECVVFHIPAGNVVPPHFDDSTGRDRPHFTFCLNDSAGGVLWIGDDAHPLPCAVTFSPVLQQHSLRNGGQDLFLMQMPLV